MNAPLHVETPDAASLIGGRFEVVRTLGDGAFAVVYEAIDRELGRRVALKLFNCYAPEEVDLALREARAMAGLNHANVLAVHDIGEHCTAGPGRGTPFLALEYAETDLHRWLMAAVRDPATILSVYIEAGRGLAAAHRAGLVHHDFKPANVMLRPDGSVAVGDFGLARHLDSQDEDTSDLGEGASALGTLRYISPERLLGHAGDPRSDQFSFCVALWEALCGEHPFAGLDAARRYESIAAGPAGSPRALTRLRGGGHIVRALRRGLAVEPTARFPDMDALLAELAQTARPKSWRPSQIVRRGLRPALSIVALTSVLVLSLFSSREGTADGTTPMAVIVADAGMENATALAFDGDYQQVITMLTKVMPVVRETDEARQHQYLAQLEVLGDLLLESGAYTEAAITYAAGKSLSRRLDVDPNKFVHKRTIAQAKAQRAKRSTASDDPTTPRGK
jgi:tRNA A-37 threonylcarbamoyl transferase component Bud32